MSKGAAATVMTIILIVIILLLLAIYVKMVSDRNNREMELNLLSAAMLRAENTYNLLKRSLGMTWYVSTVQTVFKAGDESIGCGFADDENSFVSGGFVPNDMKESYWYEGKMNPKTPINGDENCKTPVIFTTKYNVNPCNPMMCSPKASDVVKYLENKMKEYHDIKTKFIVNNIEAKIADENKEGIQTQFNVEDEKISSKTNEQLSLNDGMRTTINNIEYHDATIYTQLGKMVRAGVYATQQLYVLALRMQEDKNYRYAPAVHKGDEFKEKKKEDIINTIKSFNKEPGLQMKDVDTDVRIKIFEVISRGDETSIPDSVQLVLHYDAEVSMIEGAGEEEVPAAQQYDWPTISRKLSSCYGPRIHPVFGDTRFHRGIDIAPVVQGQGEDVMAAENGEVVETENSCVDGDKKCGSGYGNFVILKHEDGFFTFYGHMQKDSIMAQEGSDVAKGQIIGRMGTTGVSTGVHLHFEVRKDVRGETVDPCKFIDCTQSEVAKCKSLTLKEGFEGYYYNDEDADTFYKRPVSLVFGVEDYLYMLDCRDYTSESNPVATYSWKNNDDMACCGLRLWVCCQDAECSNIDIPSISDEYKFYEGRIPQKWSSFYYCNRQKVSCQDGSFIFG